MLSNTYHNQFPVTEEIRSKWGWIGKAIRKLECLVLEPLNIYKSALYTWTPTGHPQ